MTAQPQGDATQVSLKTYIAGKWARRSGAVGAALEFYDFFVYTQAAAIIFPSIFFPTGNAQAAIIGSLATWGVGYVIRPIAAIIMGAVADRVGRRFTLIFTIIMMGIATFGIGLLPTYVQVGLWAPALLVFLRLVQGFGVAGDQSTSAAFILEQTPTGLRGRWGSVTNQGTQFGQILAAALFIPLARLLSHDAFYSWGWRVPFLLSAVLIVFAMIIRLRTYEIKPVVEKKVAPIARVFQESPKAVGLVFIMALMNIVPTTTTTFGAAMATQKAYGLGWNADVYLWIPVSGNILAVILIPYVGRLTDRIGRRPVIIAGALSSGVLSYAYLWAITQNNVALAIILALLMWGALYQGYNAVYAAFYPEQFPPGTRVTGMALSQNVGTAVSSLMAVLFAAICGPGTDFGHIILVVGSITFGMTILSALAAFASPETFRIRAADLGNRKAVPMPLDEYLRVRRENMDALKALRRGQPIDEPPESGVAPSVDNADKTL